VEDVPAHAVQAHHRLPPRDQPRARLQAHLRRCKSSHEPFARSSARFGIPTHCAVMVWHCDWAAAIEVRLGSNWGE